MKQIGFIGVGIMGKGMVRNLMKAGYQLHLYARNPQKIAEIVAEGAVFHDSIAGCVQASDAVITIVGFPKDVEEVYFANGNIFDSAKQGQWLIDMTTTSPALSKRLFEEGRKRGLHVLDAPVTGGDIGAKNGTLSILVGGERADFEACVPLFQAMGNNINYQGPTGCGQHAKMANQIMISGTVAGLCEALSYAREKGLDLNTLLASVSTGAAGSRQLDTLGHKMISGDYAPGFLVQHFVKDMALASEEAAASGMKLGVLDTVLGEYRALMAKDADTAVLGTQALIDYYRK